MGNVLLMADGPRTTDEALSPRCEALGISSLILSGTPTAKKANWSPCTSYPRSEADSGKIR